MKSILFILFVFCVNSGICQTQVQYNQTATDRLKQVEEEMQAALDSIENEYQDDTTFLVAVQESQDAWLVWRDAQIRMKYPKREMGWYGSMHGMCLALYKTELTQKRVAELHVWVEGIEEGDGCVGTLKEY